VLDGQQRIAEEIGEVQGMIAQVSQQIEQSSQQSGVINLNYSTAAGGASTGLLLVLLILTLRKLAFQKRKKTDAA